MTARLAYDYAAAAEASSYSVAVIKKAVAAGDVPAHAGTVDGKPLAKPVIFHDDLIAWIRGRR